MSRVSRHYGRQIFLAIGLLDDQDFLVVVAEFQPALAFQPCVGFHLVCQIVLR